MIRQQAFENTGNKMLKGGLHCHTTRSDGKIPPDETIRIYKEHDFDFLSLTDHRKYNFATYAPDVDLLIVPGMEMDYNMPEHGGLCRHCFHEVVIGPVEGNGYVQDQKFERPDVKDQFELQPYLDEIHANNNLTIYCHPGWSTTSAREFEQLKGNVAMEIWNTECVRGFDMDKDAMYWDELLRQGIRIWGVATDDTHKYEGVCQGWVRVNAEKNVDSILNAIKNGAFYSSCGPEIYDFYVEDGKAVIKCSPAKMIRFHYGYRPNVVKRAEDELLTAAETAVGETHTYIRASITDEQGRMAWTNPIYLND